jgi:hypothetical protein
MTNENLICKLFEMSAKMVYYIDQLAINNDMVDFTSYIEWKDKLNELSMDPDREDSK